MQYILSLWANNSFNKPITYIAYNNKNSDVYSEVLDPGFAKHFETAQEALDWANENIYLIEDVDVVPFQTAFEAFKKWKESGLQIGERLIINKEISRLYNNEDKFEILDWWWNSNVSNCLRKNQITQDHYSSWPKLYTRFKHLQDVSGHYAPDHETIFYTFQIKVNRDSDFECFQEEINLVKDRIVCKNDKNEIIFDVMDYILHEQGDFVTLLYNKENNYWKIMYREDRTEVDYTDLRTCFAYLKEYRYYE